VTQAFAEGLTDVTLQLFNGLLEKLPPTPSRFHYVFNLRDLSRVYEGLLRSTQDTVQQPADFLRLWRNEVRTAHQLCREHALDVAACSGSCQLKFGLKLGCVVGMC
jgi:hypothetical protein